MQTVALYRVSHLSAVWGSNLSLLTVGDPPESSEGQIMMKVSVLFLELELLMYGTLHYVVTCTPSVNPHVVSRTKAPWFPLSLVMTSNDVCAVCS